MDNKKPNTRLACGLFALIIAACLAHLHSRRIRSGLGSTDSLVSIFPTTTSHREVLT